MIHLKQSTRSFLLCLIGLAQVFSNHSLWAQENPVTPPQPDPKTVEAFLKWEEAYRKIQKLECQMEVLETDKAFDEKRKSKAFLRAFKMETREGMKHYYLLDFRDKINSFVKSNKGISNAFYDKIKKEQNPYQYLNLKLTNERFQGNFFEILFETSIIMNFELSLFSMESKKLLEKYQFKLVKDDEHYFYFDIFPLNKNDRLVFLRARLVLSKSNHLPRQLWRELPNGTELLIDIKSINLEPNLEFNDVLLPINPKQFD